MVKPASWLVLAAGALLTAIVYVPRLNAPLVWDDRSLIDFNAALERPVPFADYLTPRYFDFSREYSWRPLSTLSYRAILRVFGKSPAALRGFSLLLHLLAGLLLLGLLRSWSWAEEASCWAAALFWLHPAHAETLMCAAFNKEPLAALGLLSMLWAHGKGRALPAAASLAFALLAKETGLAGPLLALGLDYASGGAALCRRRRGAYVLYAAVAGVYGVIRFAPLAGPVAGLALALPFSERLFYALAGLETAWRVFLLPFRLRLEYFALPPASSADWLIRGTAAAAIAAAWTLACARLARKDRRLAFLCLWPLPFLALTSSLVPTGALNTRWMAERWLYLPALGACALAAFGLCRLPRARIPVLVLAGLWGALSAVRAADWADEPRLWRGLVELYPWSAKAQEGLGEALARGGRPRDALESFEAARALRDGRRDKLLAHYVPLAHGLLRWESPSLYRWLGDVESALGDLPKAEADFEKAVALDPADGYAYRVMAYRWAAAGDRRRAALWAERGKKAAR